MTKITIIYYSSTGNNHKLAVAAGEGAASLGAEVRIRKVKELAPDAAIDSRAEWRAHVDATSDVPEAQLDDLDWADGFIVGTPTRFGLPAAQIKQFLDQCGPLWAQGKLQDKPVGAFTGAGNAHGGQESTILALNNVFYHWGCLIVPTGYTDPIIKATGGNPYGVSFTDTRSELPQDTLDAAQYLGKRVTKFATAVASLRD